MERFNADWTNAISNELNTALRSPLIDEFGVVRDNQHLPLSIFECISCRR